ncbi:MAG: GTP-binding protein [Thermoprotei archaeon]|nr:MAG: GTP-binding protein [Thermoprotei archaeon]RLF00293.1 MAG: GTP-binding protein [Thermoprotei archaeon]
MPANLPAEAKAKWRKYLEARTPEEKLKALQEFLSAVPRHKGTEKLVSQIRHKIAVLRREIEEKKRKRKGRGPRFFIEKEGDVQIILVGLANSGKSSLLAILTNAKTEISNMPYTTKKPVPGMFVYKGIYFQLVDTPSLIGESIKDTAIDRQVATMIRNADGVIIVLDALQDPLRQLALIEKKLRNMNIVVRPPKGYVKIKRRRTGGIVVVGKLKGATGDDVAKLLRSYGIYHALVRIVGEADLDSIEEAIFGNITYKPSIILINKSECLSHNDRKMLQSSIQKHYPLAFISCVRNEINVEYIFNKLMEILDLNRIYLKEPGKPPSPRPLVVKGEIKVSDLARIIPSLANREIRYAKVWSRRLPFSPQKVGLDFVLRDGDTVEIH